MKTMNRIFTTLMALFFVGVAILSFSADGMSWTGLFLLVFGAALIFGAVSGRWWVRPL